MGLSYGLSKMRRSCQNNRLAVHDTQDAEHTDINQT